VDYQEAKKFLISKCSQWPKLLITLGSGLGSLLDKIVIDEEILFSSVPGFKSPSVTGHQGKILLGKLGKNRIACLQGRLHFYEGYSLKEVVFPFQVLAHCGVDTFFLTNAAGGVHQEMHPGELLLVRDHINLLGSNPLIGPNLNEWGPRFPDMTHVYDPALSDLLRKIAREKNILLREGVYAAVHGPSYETPAEVRMLKFLGADVIGMSTVPEAIALRHLGKKVVAVSCITNLAAGVGPHPLDHSEVLEAGKAAQGSFFQLIQEFSHEFHSV